jgi:hypothetical protein
MEELHLQRRYRSIFLAGPTFNLLPDDETAGRALAAIRGHLTDDGQALIPLFVPTTTPPEQLGVAREYRRADGVMLRVIAVREQMDERTRTRTTWLRYERQAQDGLVERLERPWVLHWYDRDGFERLGGEAGLEVIAVGRADPDDPDGTWQVRLRCRA